MKSTGRTQYTQALVVVSGWSVTDAYTTVLDKYNQGIEALNAKLQSEEDDDGETRALYTRNIYRDTFEVTVLADTKVHLSVLAKQLNTAVSNNVDSLTESMNAYGSFLPVVQETIAECSPTRCPVPTHLHITKKHLHTLHPNIFSDLHVAVVRAQQRLLTMPDTSRRVGIATTAAKRYTETGIAIMSARSTPGRPAGSCAARRQGSLGGTPGPLLPFSFYALRF